MKKTIKQYAFLFESTSIVNPSDMVILESKVIAGGGHKVIFEARLQTLGEVNQNRRYYSVPIGESIVEQLTPKAVSRNLLMEVDHPIPDSTDPNVMKRRASIVEISNCGALIRNIKKRDNEIIGEIETLSGFKGPDLAKLIVDDGVDIGFSLRALGGLDIRSDGIAEVTLPMRAITYDVVSAPSHATAKKLEFLPESYMGYVPSSQFLYESEDLNFLNEDQITICEGNSCVVKFISDIIEERFKDVVSSKIRFNI